MFVVVLRGLKLPFVSVVIFFVRNLLFSFMQIFTVQLLNKALAFFSYRLMAVLLHNTKGYMIEVCFVL